MNPDFNGEVSVGEAAGRVYASRYDGSSSLSELLTRLQVDPQIASIAIKLNLCEYRASDSGATTSVTFISALVRSLRARCPALERIVLLEQDSSGTRVSDLFGLLGFTRLCQELDLELFDPAAADWILVDEVGPLPIELPSLIWDVECYINVPKMKVHAKTLFTGALKNNFGLLRRKWKVPYHSHMCQTIIAANAHLPRQLCLMDGSVTLSGRGPAYGIPHQSSVALGSWDPVAIDAAGAALLGIPPPLAGHIRLAGAAGLGQSRPDLVWISPDRGLGDRPTIDWLRLVAGNVLRRS